MKSIQSIIMDQQSPMSPISTVSDMNSKRYRLNSSIPSQKYNKHQCNSKSQQSNTYNFTSPSPMTILPITASH